MDWPVADNGRGGDHTVSEDYGEKSILFISPQIFLSKRCLPTGLFAVAALICLAPGHEYSTPKIKQEAKVREGNLNTWQCFNAVIYFKYINT